MAAPVLLGALVALLALSVAPAWAVTPPVIEEESVLAVAGTSATLQAKINPDKETTGYWFEYATSEAALLADKGSVAPVPPAQGEAGEGTIGVVVEVQVQGLASHTTYWYRVLAKNPSGEAVGCSGPTICNSFTTQPSGGEFALQDGRRWELVSPLDKEGGAIEPSLAGSLQVAADGGAFTYYASAPLVDAEGFTGPPERSQYFSVRTADGWTTTDIATPHSGATPTEAGNGSEYRFFSIDLERALVEPIGETVLSPQATEYTPYVREGLRGALSPGCEAPCYLPLLTTADVSPGVEFGPARNQDYEKDAHFLTATPDLSHVILSSAERLTENTVDKAGVGKEPENVYEWSKGHLELISILPDGKDATEEGGEAAAYLAYKDEHVAHSVSTDGKRIVWENHDHELFLRDIGRQETLVLNENRGGSGGGSYPRPKFETASDDLRRVLFTDERQIAPGSTANSGKPQLYVFEITSGPEEPLTGRLTDLTPGEEHGEVPYISSGVSGEFGWIFGASKAGSYVYFVAHGVLAGATNNKRGESASPGEGNLYIRHYDSASESWEPPVFIATLAAGDTPEWSSSTGAGSTVRVSPNGRYLAFMSANSLTGYDNRDVVSGERDEEVYLYDAQSRILVCPSCNPTGARPHGAYDEGRPLVDRPSNWEGHWLAGLLPGWIGPRQESIVGYQPRYLSNAGRLFFDSPDALNPQDTNGMWDVYEYEPTGEGDCTGANADYMANTEGCIDLLSSGLDPNESVFLDASEDGGEAFFLTAAKLVPHDAGSELNVYDARECTSSSPCIIPAVSPPACTTTDSCREAPTQQPSVFGPASSATFSGQGDLALPTSKSAVRQTSLTRAQKLARALKACRKKKNKRKRVACERQAGKSYEAKASGAKKGRKANASKRDRR